MIWRNQLIFDGMIWGLIVFGLFYNIEYLSTIFTTVLWVLVVFFWFGIFGFMPIINRIKSGIAERRDLEFVYTLKYRPAANIYYIYGIILLQFLAMIYSGNQLLGVLYLVPTMVILQTGHNIKKGFYDKYIFTKKKE